MENSLRYRDAPTMLPSPTSYSSCSISSSSNNNSDCKSTRPGPVTTTARSESANPYPTTFVQADTSSFKQVVQMLTGSSETAKLASSLKPTTNPTQQPDPVPAPPKSSHSIPPIKSIPKKPNSSGFRLYERRNSLKNLKISPLNAVFNPGHNSGFSPRKPEILSPSILDFPALVLSPVTPLIPDPFDRSGSANQSPSNCGSSSAGNNNRGGESKSNADAAEEKAIKEKGFYLHPSPATTPRDSEPRLLPLFPVTSPRVSGSSTASSTS